MLYKSTLLLKVVWVIWTSALSRWIKDVVEINDESIGKMLSSGLSWSIWVLEKNSLLEITNLPWLTSIKLDNISTLLITLSPRIMISSGLLERIKQLALSSVFKVTSRFSILIEPPYRKLIRFCNSKVLFRIICKKRNAKKKMLISYWYLCDCYAILHVKRVDIDVDCVWLDRLCVFNIGHCNSAVVHEW